MGFGGLFSQPLGYLIIRDQVEGVKDYDEDQVALVVPDSTAFGSWELVTLGTGIISWITNMFKEIEIDEWSACLNGWRVPGLMACHWAELSIRGEMVANQTMDPTDLNEAFKMLKKEKIEVFWSKIIHAQTKTIFLGSNIQVMTQTL